MGTRDLNSRIKSRLTEWENYRTEPAPMPSEVQSAFADSGHNNVESYDSAIVEVRIEPQFGDAPVRSDSSATSPELIELQTALEHERDQSRRLMEVVEREQVLHAVTLHSHQQQKSAHLAQEHTVRTVTRITSPAPVYPRYTQSVNSKTGARAYVWWVLLALLISVGCAGLAYSLVR